MKKTTAKLNKWIVAYECGGYAESDKGLPFCGIASFCDDWTGYVIDSVWDNEEDAELRHNFIHNNGVRGEKVSRVWFQQLTSRGKELFVELYKDIAKEVEKEIDFLKAVNGEV